MAAGGARNFFAAMVAILVVLVIAYLFLSDRGGGGGASATDTVQDGSLLSFACGSAPPKIVKASYGPLSSRASDCEAVDLTAWLQSWVSAHPGKPLEVGPDVFPGAPACPGVTRALRVAYRCPGEGFRPHRVDTCSAAQDALPAAMEDPDYSLHQWTGQDNENWTVEVTPWDPDSRIQLTAAALAPSTRAAYRPINPLTRIGVTSRVRNWDNPYAGDDISSDPCSSAVSIYEVQPFEPGFLIPKANDSTDDTMAEQRYYYQPAYWSRASGPYGGPYKPVASCPEDVGVDSNFRVDGSYETMAAREMTGDSSAAYGSSALPAQYGETFRGGPTAYGSSALPAQSGETFHSGPGAYGSSAIPWQDGETFHGGEFWWQLAGASPGQPWYDDRTQRNLGQLVGVSPPVGAVVDPGPQMRPAFEIPKATFASRAPRAQQAPKETLRSRGNYRAVARADDCLSGIGCGLGSTWIDSRFEPGPQEMYYGGDAIWAQGGHAGGPTFGSFTPSVFLTSGTWNDYVHGFGDGTYVAPRAPPNFRVHA